MQNAVAPAATQTLKVQVEVSKEAYELGQGLVAFVKTVKGALADGWQPGQDLPKIMVSAIGDLVPAMDGVALIGDELKANPAAAYAAFGLALKELAASFAS